MVVLSVPAGGGVAGMGSGAQHHLLRGEANLTLARAPLEKSHNLVDYFIVLL
jgi:hypothetical protein